jgi:hypothetical protein
MWNSIARKAVAACYSFDIRHHPGTQEVGVDAKTRNVVENAPEGPNPD